MHFETKRVRLTALAEFDLVEAQNFYAPSGAWVVEHFMTSIDQALTKLSEMAGIHPMFYGHFIRIFHFPSIMISKAMM